MSGMREKAERDKGYKMSDGMLLWIRDDGRAELYDDTYDITIHCSSKEEQDAARVLLKRAGAIPQWVSQDDIPRWIPCSERLPEKGGKYLCCWQGKTVDTGMFLNGHFRLYGEIKDHLITAWMPLPELYKPEERKDGENHE